MLFQKQQGISGDVKMTRDTRIKAGLFGIIGGLMVGVAGMSGGRSNYCWVISDGPSND